MWICTAEIDGSHTHKYLLLWTQNFCRWRPWALVACTSLAHALYDCRCILALWGMGAAKYLLHRTMSWKYPCICISGGAKRCIGHTEYPTHYHISIMIMTMAYHWLRFWVVEVHTLHTFICVRKCAHTPFVLIQPLNIRNLWRICTWSCFPAYSILPYFGTSCVVFNTPFQLVDPIVLCVRFLLTYWWLTFCSYIPTQLIMACFQDNTNQVQR